MRNTTQTATTAPNPTPAPGDARKPQSHNELLEATLRDERVCDDCPPARPVDPCLPLVAHEPTAPESYDTRSSAATWVDTALVICLWPLGFVIALALMPFALVRQAMRGFALDAHCEWGRAADVWAAANARAEAAVRAEAEERARAQADAQAEAEAQTQAAADGCAAESANAGGRGRVA